MNRTAVTVALYLLAGIFTGSVLATTEYNSKPEFETAVGPELITQDWSSYPVNTVLEGVTLDGITYQSGDTLVVGSSHGGGYRLGFTSDGVRYRSFSGHTVSFKFEEPIDAFGIALSQGNQSGGIRNVGYTLWSVLIDQVDEYIVRVDYDLNDRSGEAYLGLLGLEEATLVEVRRIYSDAGITWNIRELAYRVYVPDPTIFIDGFENW